MANKIRAIEDNTKKEGKNFTFIPIELEYKKSDLAGAFQSLAVLRPVAWHHSTSPLDWTM